MPCSGKHGLVPISIQIHQQRGAIVPGARVEAPEERLEVLRLAGEPPPSPELAGALIDTGASQSHVDLRILQRLGLPPLGKTTFYTTQSKEGKPSEAYIYHATHAFRTAPDR